MDPIVRDNLQLVEHVVCSLATQCVGVCVLGVNVAITGVGKTVGIDEGAVVVGGGVVGVMLGCCVGAAVGGAGLGRDDRPVQPVPPTRLPLNALHIILALITNGRGMDSRLEYQGEYT